MCPDAPWSAKSEGGGPPKVTTLRNQKKELDMSFRSSKEELSAEKIVQKLAIEKWNGAYPTTVLGDKTVPMTQINSKKED
jgi:hypothetical protein